MNPMLLKALFALTPMLVLLFGAATLYARIKTSAALAQVFGAACLVIVALAHVCEALNLFPSMGWGAKSSIGHYIDLASAVFGSALFLIGYVCYALGKRDASAA